MLLMEKIFAANQRGAGPGAVDAAEFPGGLPIAVLTCIDPRLNALFPDVLGLRDHEMIWLRNAGNIIFGSLSSMMRSIALACVIKQGKEIAIIGHSDCLVRRASVFDLTNRFSELGVPRDKLPENLNEFFGLFASERQNVMRGVEFARQSPLIGPRIPVHGLLLDLESRRLEWIVNGYDALGTATASVPVSVPSALAVPVTQAAAMVDRAESKLPEWQIGKFEPVMPATAHGQAETVADVRAAGESKLRIAAERAGAAIGKMDSVLEQAASSIQAAATSLGHTETAADIIAAGESKLRFAAERADAAIGKMDSVVEQVASSLHATVDAAAANLAGKINRLRQYRVIGTDNKTYGPVSGAKVIEWLAEGRVTPATPIQPVGSSEWSPLARLTDAAIRSLPLPPKLVGGKPKADKHEHGPYL